MKKAVLDTHVLVFWRSDPSRLTAAQREHLEVMENSEIGIKLLRLKGFSKQKDQYAILEIGISFNIMNYRCPSAR